MRWITSVLVGLLLLTPLSVFADNWSHSSSSESSEESSSDEWTADSWNQLDSRQSLPKESGQDDGDFYKDRGGQEFERTDEFDDERERRKQESIEEESRRKEAEKEDPETQQALPERNIRRKDGRDGQGVRSFYEDDYVWLVDSIKDIRLRDMYRSTGARSGSRMYLSQDEFGRPLLAAGLFSGQYLYPNSVVLEDPWFMADELPTKKVDKEDIPVVESVPLIPVNFGGVFTADPYNQVYGTENLFSSDSVKKEIDQAVATWAKEHPDELVSYLVSVEYESIEDKVPSGVYVMWAGVDSRGYFTPIQVKGVDGIEQEVLYHQSYYFENEDPDVVLDYETLAVEKKGRKDKKQSGWDARDVDVPELIRQWCSRIFSTDYATTRLGFTVNQSRELEEAGFFETYHDPTDISTIDRLFGLILRNPAVFILLAVVLFLAVAASSGP